MIIMVFILSSSSLLLLLLLFKIWALEPWLRYGKVGSRGTDALSILPASPSYAAPVAYTPNPRSPLPRAPWPTPQTHDPCPMPVPPQVHHASLVSEGGWALDPTPLLHAGVGAVLGAKVDNSGEYLYMCDAVKGLVSMKGAGGV